MSHEIRTPMNGIIGMSHLLLDTDLTQEQRRQAAIIRSSSESLLLIINDILDLSKLEAGKFEIQNIPFEFDELLADIFSSMAITAANKKLELLCQIDRDVPNGLMGDPQRLRQILVNLLGNALKFTSKGHVLLKASSSFSKDGKVLLHIEVNDTGQGIEESLRGGIFTPFSLSEESGVEVVPLVKIFGEHLFGRFVDLYPEFFEGRESCFSFLELIETHVHVEVRKLYPDAELPTFATTQPEPRILEMTYQSVRPLAPVAEGLILGCIAHFKENITVKVEDLSGDNTHARFTMEKLD